MNPKCELCLCSKCASEVCRCESQKDCLRNFRGEPMTICHGYVKKEKIEHGKQ